MQKAKDTIPGKLMLSTQILGKDEFNDQGYSNDALHPDLYMFTMRLRYTEMHGFRLFESIDYESTNGVF